MSGSVDSIAISVGLSPRPIRRQVTLVFCVVMTAIVTIAAVVLGSISHKFGRIFHDFEMELPFISTLVVRPMFWVCVWAFSMTVIAIAVAEVIRAKRFLSSAVILFLLACIWAIAFLFAAFALSLPLTKLIQSMN